MATKAKAKKTSAGKSKAAKANQRSLAAKAKRDKKATGNTALDRANAVAKKGATKIAKAAKFAVGTLEGAIEKAATKKKPQFFGRPKTKKTTDPAKIEQLKQERNAQHSNLMKLDWYREYRETSINLWVERRKALAAGDTEAVEKINKKLEAAAKKRNKARAEWKEAGSKIPAGAPKKAEKKAAKKSAGKQARKSKKAAEPQAEESAEQRMAAPGFEGLSDNADLSMNSNTESGAGEE